MDRKYHNTDEDPSYYFIPFSSSYTFSKPQSDLLLVNVLLWNMDSFNRSRVADHDGLINLFMEVHISI